MDGKHIPICFVPTKSVKTMSVDNIETVPMMQERERIEQIKQKNEKHTNDEDKPITVPIPETITTIKHVHSEHKVWHKHNIQHDRIMKVEDPCFYCGVPSAGIYKFYNQPVCLNCYFEICNICNGVVHEVSFNNVIRYNIERKN